MILSLEYHCSGLPRLPGNQVSRCLKLLYAHRLPVMFCKQFKSKLSCFNLSCMWPEELSWIYIKQYVLLFPCRYLSHNHLSSLPAGLFDYLQQLTHLYVLSYRNFRFLELFTAIFFLCFLYGRPSMTKYHLVRLKIADLEVRQRN